MFKHIKERDEYAQHNKIMRNVYIYREREMYVYMYMYMYVHAYMYTYLRIAGGAEQIKRSSL